MTRPVSLRITIACLILLAAVVFVFSFFSFNEKEVDFNTEVKPIINKKCISCHGGVKAKVGFSLLFEEEALAPNESGKPAIIPGHADESELIRRITETDPEQRMPYRHEALTKAEIKTLVAWIDQGAKWGEHWAYSPVEELPVPETSDDWVRNDIDRFILNKLEAEDLSPSPEADKATLLRRVSLDLIGMYPSDALAKQYLDSNNPDAYSVLVDSLMASKHFGERWAAMWLDLARYADTKGYESDYGRSMWRYRDWVIKAFNNSMPYDQFITEQMAGDLLPNPTNDQYIATGFHRSAMTNDEGGTINEEFRTSGVLDRVNTTWESLMGTTFACVQCHSHPYDPFKHDEYYQFMAYFNNTSDEDVPNDYPQLRFFNDSSQQELNGIIDWVKGQSSQERARETELFLKTKSPAIYAELADSLFDAAIGNNNWSLYFHDKSRARIPHVDLNGIDQLTYQFKMTSKQGVLSMHLDAPDGPLVKKWTVTTQPFMAVTVALPPQTGIHDVYFTFSHPEQKGPGFVLVFDWFAFNKQLPGKGSPGYANIERKYNQLLNASIPSMPVMMENPATRPRSTYVFERGAWTAKGKEVTAAVPNSLAYAMPDNAPKNRLGLSMWLTDEKNPLVSRTLVNRLWEQLFGAGIVETLEDMGTQGMPPTHRELLDHLSWKLMHDYKWSFKSLLKEMVTSATYRQQSKVSDELNEKDFFNKFYARGPRVRLSAEQLRDQHLCISGVISDKMYGPGVMPWQPEGIWHSPYNSERWNKSKGEDQYRRAVYTYWKRGAPYPSMVSFDAPQRVVCSARRIRTNTPLQALVLLNDSAYVDMARHFAKKMETEGGKEIDLQIAQGYQRMMFKPITPEKLMVLTDLYKKAIDEFVKAPEKAVEIQGDEKGTPSSAALIVVANAMLNFDEVITKN